MTHPLDTLRAAFTTSAPSAPGPKPAEPTFAYAVWRFLTARAAESGLGTVGLRPDTAVLLRQAIRWGGGEVRLPAVADGDLALLARAGIELTATGTLRASPFRPHWLTGDRIDPDVGVDPPPAPARIDTALPGEPYLAEMGGGGDTPRRAYTHWQSAAQKEATWRALSSPGGGTCVIVLPTGTGKSLVFQALAARSQGLTVVVVPTVALAIDQFRAARDVVPALCPRYYAAGDDTDTVIEELRQRRCRLVLTSPEACVSGHLRGLLQSFAAEGWLDNLVIDEVHLVESWGAYFRVDFQLLAGVRTEWLAQPGARLRTLLLTATLTPSGRDDLRVLFPPVRGGAFWEFLSQRLRPEMVYHDRRFGPRADRDAAVLECVWRLPRPAILYVTERKDAEAWSKRLVAEEGFARVGCFHGDTPSARRRELLDAWRADQLDVMVATSAFGLGVDKPDVRAVVHACYPEDMNRYYQEVGRGGRDGWTTTCLLLPTERDEKVAFGLGPRYMTPELLNKRWQALSQPDYCQRIPGPEEVWRIDPAAVRIEMLGQRTGKENVLWNKRLLLQLQRAGHLSLRGVSYERDAEGDAHREWIEAELRFNPHRQTVGELVDGPRTEELSAGTAGLKRVGEYLACTRCVSLVLAGLYGDNVQRVCGGCRHCRRAGTRPRGCPELEWECAPHQDHRPASVLVGGLPDPVADGDAFQAAARGCIERKSVRRFATTPEYHDAVTRTLAAVYGSLPPYLRSPYRIDALHDTALDLLPGETAVVFHLGRAAAGAIDAHGGAEVIHWFRPPVSLSDLRYPLAERGVLDFRHYTGPDDWFRS